MKIECRLRWTGALVLLYGAILVGVIGVGLIAIGRGFYGYLFLTVATIGVGSFLSTAISGRGVQLCIDERGISHSQLPDGFMPWGDITGISIEPLGRAADMLSLCIECRDQRAAVAKLGIAGKFRVFLNRLSGRPAFAIDLYQLYPRPPELELQLNELIRAVQPFAIGRHDGPS
jgi:hypothetical protein